MTGPESAPGMANSLQPSEFPGSSAFFGKIRTEKVLDLRGLAATFPARASRESGRRRREDLFRALFVGLLQEARYLDGVVPNVARKRALKVERSPKPLSSATERTESFDVFRRRAARIILARKTY